MTFWSLPLLPTNILQEVFNLLRVNNLELKIIKCRFLQSAVNYLGYLADNQGISPNRSHVETLRNYPVPRNTRSLQSCIGLFSYFRRFVPNLSRIAGPLYNALKKKTVCAFNSECMQSFNSLREALINAPVFSIYNSNRETELHTDASSDGFGTVLLQKQKDNKWHPVSYYSHRTSVAESNQVSWIRTRNSGYYTCVETVPSISRRYTFRIIKKRNSIRQAKCPPCSI